MLRILVAATLALNAIGGKAEAHEFWISPERYQVPTGEALVAALRVGEEFDGAGQPYIPRNITRFEVLSQDGGSPVEGRIGDYPALQLSEAPDGLAIIVHETTSRNLTWDEWDRFLRFAEHKDLGDVTAWQAERGLDQVDVTEDYIRYAKSLVSIGEGVGTDRVVGLRTELVALANPYTDDLAGIMPVQLWLDGEPRTDAQIELFARPIVDADDSVSDTDTADAGETATDADTDADAPEVMISLHRTDGNGVVLLPVEPGYEYLVDAVSIEPADPETGAEWRTLWASLTFALPLAEEMTETPLTTP